jgi:hypothetical protein
MVVLLGNESIFAVRLVLYASVQYVDRMGFLVASGGNNGATAQCRNMDGCDVTTVIILKCLVRCVLVLFCLRYCSAVGCYEHGKGGRFYKRGWMSWNT